MAPLALGGGGRLIALLLRHARPVLRILVEVSQSIFLRQWLRRKALPIPSLPRGQPLARAVPIGSRSETAGGNVLGVRRAERARGLGRRALEFAESLSKVVVCTR